MTKNDDSRTPQEWREILRSWDYPEEVDTGRRRERRRARKAHRADARRRTTQWVREERRRDPIKPTAALVIVALILGLGAGARWLWPGLTGGSDRPAGSVSASPTPAAQDDKPGTDETATSSPSSTPSPAADLSEPEHVAEEAIRRYLTRNPPADGDHSAPVLRAAPYMAPALVENLASSSDPAWDKLVSRGGVATVTTIKAGPVPEKEGLPVDTPLRVWRQVTAKVHVEGYTAYDEQHVLQVELTNPSGDAWRASRILGL
ncbi:hypothetical protein [Streptomyces varsoviensis]|uniref:Aromatic ring-opening dioxygenase LigA n=1 Tax=Streptomyces varsoviensis TaxID=67373 RepID=A0ABR5IXW7_9ACTN|nr:hypothetical protein [Streptomyces varsoviensis]KOG86005.1 hypothetical protein ADK38_33465 [Streptomyces varsoviensis]